VKIAALECDTGDLVQLQRRYTRVALDNLRSPVLRHVLSVWDSKRNGRAWPAREELRPQDFAPYLRHLSLARVIDGSDDFELRIIGDEIIQAYGENFTGRTLSSIAELVGDDVVSAYEAVVLEGSPILLQGSFEGPHDHHFRREVVLMPLGTEGKVNFVLSAGMLTPRDSASGNDCAIADTVAA
jgi:hypothetical protein